MGCTPTPTFMEHLKLTFVAAKPPPSHVFTEVALMEAEESGSLLSFSRGGGQGIPWALSLRWKPHGVLRYDGLES